MFNADGTDVSDSTLRFPIYSALAYGAQGIWYFTYRNALTSYPEQYWGSRSYRDARARVTPLYDVAKKANWRVRAWGDDLLGCTSHGTVSTGWNIENAVRSYLMGDEGNGGDKQGDSRYQESDFMAVAAIRYVDDFIDQALWPGIPDFDPDDLSRRFEVFLRDALRAVQSFDPCMPERILMLPRLEMHLALYPRQDVFDHNFMNLFSCKAFDMLYIYQRIRGRDCEDIEPVPSPSAKKPPSPKPSLRLRIMLCWAIFSSMSIRFWSTNDSPLKASSASEAPPTCIPK